ncbi:hypothetical protein GOP47_0018439 [Adiantum capillus-veneris]|uniref:Uncharacterized protein n=1 Tax=Adiantum capillus-veneris TaxID=13818 RepID=A0A9D4Z9K3_ADICA|nr:hypothetical protein GOP47_0018439 [Adiantum capillus-veneris]
MDPVKEKGVQVVDTFMDLEAPTISLEIGSHSMTGVQLDGGVAVSLMTEQTIGELGLKQVEPTNIILRLADQRRVKPLGILQGVKTIVAGLEFYVSYLIVQPHSYGASFPILLGRPWLVQARCVQSWHKGVIIIGPRDDRVELQVVSKEFLREYKKPIVSKTEENTNYSGDKSEDEEAIKQHFSLNTDKYSQFLHNGYHMRIEDDSTRTISTTQGVGKYACHLGMGEYEIHYSSGYDSDKDIAQWVSTSDE